MVNRPQGRNIILEDHSRVKLLIRGGWKVEHSNSTREKWVKNQTQMPGPCIYDPYRQMCSTNPKERPPKPINLILHLHPHFHESQNQTCPHQLKDNSLSSGNLSHGQIENKVSRVLLQKEKKNKLVHIYSIPLPVSAEFTTKRWHSSLQKAHWNNGPFIGIYEAREWDLFMTATKICARVL